MNPDERAESFLTEDKQFRLGFLPTEQPHPATARFSQTMQNDPEAGIRQLQAVDRDILALARHIFHGIQFHALCDLIRGTLDRGGRILLYGCGATGRLAILLASAWREAFAESRLAGAVDGIMTGGDYAFMRSVESFEDYTSFGEEQVRSARIGCGDLLIGISEGGETSSVLGAIGEAVRTGAGAVFICNNPHDLLRSHIDRSRRVLEDTRVLALDLTTGPMAIAGSTRMQATTAELLVLGAALEKTAVLFQGPHNCDAPPAPDAERFMTLLNELARADNVAAMARWAALEAELYRAGGMMTYLADRAMQDILTDTAERTPTFALPPFRRRGDTASPRPFAVARHPVLDTEHAWKGILRRAPSCLDWDTATLRRLGASPRIVENPPRISAGALMQFTIGSEPDPAYLPGEQDMAMLVCCDADGDTVRQAAGWLGKTTICTIGERRVGAGVGPASFHIACPGDASLLRLWSHLALKLTFNTVSTATMALHGRISGNWMTHLQPTNKKLIDRGSRIIAGIAGISYEEACRALFREMGDGLKMAELPSPVAAAIERFRGGTD